MKFFEIIITTKDVSETERKKITKHSIDRLSLRLKR